MSRERIAGVLLFAVIGVTLLVGSVKVARDWKDLRPRVSGDPAPAFALPVITAAGDLGPPVSLASLKGKVVVIDFWATWCEPCRASMPRLEALARAYRDRGVVLVSVNTEGAAKAKQARRMADRLAPSGVLLSDSGPVANAFGVTTIPHLAVVGPEGTIRWVHRGALVRGAEQGLVATIEDLL